MTRQLSIYDDPSVQKKALDIIQETKMPVSIDFVAFQCHISWVTARALLSQLVAEGRLRMAKTTKGWIFFINQEGMALGALPTPNSLQEPPGGSNG